MTRRMAAGRQHRCSQLASIASSTRLNSPRDVATHLGHRGLIFCAPMSACKGVWPWVWVSRPVWARSFVVEAQVRGEVTDETADLGHEASRE
jgi:hypothetical protein